MTQVRYDASDSDLDDLRPYLIGERPRSNGEWDLFCPLHEDNNRSAQLNVDEEVWYCHACEEGGTIRDLLRRKSEWIPRSQVEANGGHPTTGRSSSGDPEELSETRVKRWADALIKDELRLTELQDLRGLQKETIINYEIGWDDVRRAYTIPVRGRTGKLLNVRRYQPNPPEGRRKMWSANGHGRPWLYPAQIIAKAKYIIICEGEWDALVTNQYGFPAITRTASAGTWLEEWNEIFHNMLVLVCHDMDKAGQKANTKLVEMLEGTASEVRVVKLPYPLKDKDGADLTDWWLDHDGDKQAFRDMLRKAKPGKVVRLKGRQAKTINQQSEAIRSNHRLDPTTLTDDGNARKFIDQHRGKLIYTPGVGWFRWSRQHFSHDHEDRRMWRSITVQQVEKDVKRTLRGLLPEALDYEDQDDLQRAFKWALRCRSAVATQNCRKMAESGDPDVADLTLSVAELDKNPDIINTASGVVNLKTGRLRKHDSGELCTHITNAQYEPKADRKVWKKFLDRIMPDRDLQLFLQMCLGASITGHSTRALFVLYGPEGENGKTQLIEAVSETLGSYAGTAMESTFVNASSREAGYDLARMRGVRFISFSETREGHGLASERVKRITGDDMIDARPIYGSPFSYRPQFSLWVGTNHAPYVPAWETAMWKRIRVWPMFEVIPREEQIPDYGRTLARDHGSAILSWLVDGARTYYLNNMRLGKTPVVMEDQRVEWQRRDDIIGRWMEDRLVETPRGKVSFKTLWNDFAIWCEQQGETIALKSYTARKFHEEMDANYPQFPRGNSSGGYPTRLGLIIKGG